jgi:hypothetical protein
LGKGKGKGRGKVRVGVRVRDRVRDRFRDSVKVRVRVEWKGQRWGRIVRQPIGWDFRFLRQHRDPFHPFI